jgi:hypothetical protein
MTNKDDILLVFLRLSDYPSANSHFSHHFHYYSTLMDQQREKQANSYHAVVMRIVEKNSKKIKRRIMKNEGLSTVKELQ